MTLLAVPTTDMLSNSVTALEIVELPLQSLALTFGKKGSAQIFVV